MKPSKLYEVYRAANDTTLNYDGVATYPSLPLCEVQCRGRGTGVEKYLYVRSQSTYYFETGKSLIPEKDQVGR